MLATNNNWEVSLKATSCCAVLHGVACTALVMWDKYKLIALFKQLTSKNMFSVYTGKPTFRYSCVYVNWFDSCTTFVKTWYPLSTLGKVSINFNRLSEENVLIWTASIQILIASLIRSIFSRLSTVVFGFLVVTFIIEPLKAVVVSYVQLQRRSKSDVADWFSSIPIPG